jgi:hypothetical protein
VHHSPALVSTSPAHSSAEPIRDDANQSIANITIGTATRNARSHPMQFPFDFFETLARRGDARPQQFCASHLRGEVLRRVDTSGRALGKAPGAAFRDADAAGEHGKATLATVLGAEISDSGLGGLRHARGQL